MGGVACGEFAPPQLVPVERLLKSAQSWLQAHPADADAHYTLARIRYLAFARGAVNVPAFGETADGGKPSVAGNWAFAFDLYEARKKRAEELALQDIGERGPLPAPEKASAFEEARGRRARQLEEHDWQPRGNLPEEEMIAHAAAALAEFREAIRLDPKNGLFVLGLASLNEQFADWAAEQTPRGLAPGLRALSIASARENYLRAFRLAIAGDAGLPFLPASGLPSLVSHEAGGAYVRLVEREHTKLKGQERANLDEVRSGLRKLKKIRLGAITPIVFSLTASPRLDALIALRQRVSFDLRGYGARERWPWVRPRTALLVWDPECRGAITSARQLFGSYSFEIFRRDGYEALAALDEDGDGRLAGDELHGIRAWFDANGDGRSEPGEVRDLCELGIVAIATRATAKDGIHPTNPRGLTLSDGRTLATWDWIARPARH